MKVQNKNIVNFLSNDDSKHPSFKIQLAHMVQQNANKTSYNKHKEI